MMKRFVNSPMYVVMIYVVIGMTWIMMSDNAVFRIGDDPQMQYWYQLIKGLTYVLLTGMMLYFIIYRQHRQRNQYVKMVKEQKAMLDFIMRKQMDAVVVVAEFDGTIVMMTGGDEKKNVPLHYKTNIIIDQERGRWTERVADVFEQAKKDGESHEQIEIGEDVYRVQCDVYDEGQGVKLVCVQFFDITDQVNLLELNELKNEEVERLKREIVLQDQKMKVQEMYYQAFRDSLPEGVVIYQLDKQGHLGHVLDTNLGASLLLRSNRYEIKDRGVEPYLEFKGNDRLRLREQDFRNYPSMKLRVKLAGEGSSERKTVMIRMMYIGWGEHQCVMMHLQDVSREDAYEQMIATLSERPTQLMNYLRQGVMVTDAEGMVMYMNAAMRRILGADEMVGAELETLFERIGVYGVSIKGEGERVDEQILMAQRINKGDVWVEPRIRRMENESPGGYMITLTDVSEKRELELKQEKQESQIRQDEEFRRTFLSNLSHEIRTPMNGILGFVELLETEEISELFSHYLGYIRRSTTHLLTIMDDIVEITKLENQQMHFNKKWTKVQTLLDDLESYLRELVVREGKVIQVVIDNSDEIVGVSVYTDEKRLLQAIKKVCDNAVKYTVQGVITVSAHKRDGVIEMNISDTGVGFEASQQEAIFLPFVTYRAHREEPGEGIGLGLSISRSIIQQLGGEIIAQGKRDKGALFRVRLPQSGEPQGISRETTNGIGVNGRKVMIVQYGFNSASELQETLRSYGIEVYQANDGKGAIELYYQDQDIDLIITDIRLSDMDGFELLRALRRINKQAFVVAQTAYLMKDEMRRCNEAGFADYLLKPIDKDQVLRQLSVMKF